MAQSSWDAELLIVGATFLGIGIALQNKQGVLIAEREITAGHEFTYAYKHGEGWNEELHSEAARRFRKELLRRDALTADGRAHLPGLTPLLYRLIREERLPVRFLTDIVAVEHIVAGEGAGAGASAGEGFAVELFDSSGHRTIRVRRIIDTTSACVTKPGFAKPQGKRINALLHAAAAEAAGAPPRGRIEEAGYRLDPGRFASEAFLSIPIQPEDDWASARAKLHAFWMNRPEPLQAWSLATVADQFEPKLPPGAYEIEPGWMWQPSGAHANPLAAMDAAVRAAAREEAV